MENAREVVAKITEFPWGQFCLAPEIVCVCLCKKMWLGTFQANFRDEIKKIPVFAF